MINGSVKGKVGNASDQLNLFMGESERDVMQMKRELQATQDKLKELDKKIMQQESR